MMTRFEGWRSRHHSMGIIYRWLVRPFFRFQDSEKAHHRSLRLLRLTSALPFGGGVLKLLYHPRYNLPVELFGHTYKNPFGLAAGMDKNGIALRGWERIGLGFIEIGGVTQHEQGGNPKPRMFRANHALALVNRMGFNNEGSQKIRDHLELYFKRYGPPGVPLWVNVGKSKITPLETAHEDYAATVRALWPFIDVFVVNVSSPNTPNLRELQNDDGLVRILDACQKVNDELANEHGIQAKPILVKVAPDLTNEQLAHIALTAKKNRADGIVLSNTTIERPTTTNKNDAKVFAQSGGLSGQPLKQRSTEMIRHVRHHVGGDWPIIGVGGISSAQDALEKMKAGATLVQAYSGFVFEGPSLVKSVVHGLNQSMNAEGYTSLQSVIGVDEQPK